jgi:hypothetical protein
MTSLLPRELKERTNGKESVENCMTNSAYILEKIG